MQCHLETTHFSLPSQLLRYPQRPFTYRPGEPLGDSVLVFDHAPADPIMSDIQFRDRACRLPAAKIGVLSSQPNDVHHLPQSALDSARRASRSALHGGVPELSRNRA